MAAGAGLIGARPILAAARPAGALLNGLPSPGGPGSLPFPSLPEGTDTLPKIEHIIVVMQENHSFDCYLGMLGRGDGYTLDAAGRPINACPDGSGHLVGVHHAPSTCQAGYRVSQAWDASHQSWHFGANDGFVTAYTPPSADTMAYWTGTDLPFYWSLARNFTLCDRYFSSVMAQTYPNRRFLLAATALGQVGDPFPNITNPELPPNGTILDRLNAHGISWKNYFVDLPTTGLFPPVVENNPGKVVPLADLFVDAAAGTLPAFAIVDPESFQASEENPQDIQTGQFVTAQVISALLKSPAWPRTLLIWTYDEHGGYYDHVPPPAAVPPDDIPPAVPAGDDYGDHYSYYGFRVPAVVISPYSNGLVSHTVYDHTSILKTVESKWNLPALTRRDANANDLLGCLDFALPPRFATPPALAAAPPPTGTVACRVASGTNGL
jgi:phospholipase C